MVVNGDMRLGVDAIDQFHTEDFRFREASGYFNLQRSRYAWRLGICLGLIALGIYRQYILRVGRWKNKQEYLWQLRK